VLDLVAEMKAMLAELERDGVPYALCGALALAVHGVPRHTSDIDLLVEPAGVQAAIVAARRRGFVFGAAPMRFSDGVEVHRWSKIVDREVLTLDLLVVSPTYQAVWDGRVRVPLGDGAVTVVSRDGLVQMKLFAARPKDVADIQRLQELDR